MGIHVEEQSVVVESARFTARLDGGMLTSLVDRKTGVEFCRKNDRLYPLELLYVNNDVVGADDDQKVATKAMSPSVARVVLKGAHTSRELFVRLDDATGDLCVRPSGQSNRAGLLAVRWSVAFAREASLVLPTRNGMEVTAGQEVLPAPRHRWPSEWNAQLAIAQRGDVSMMIHSEDTRFKYKTLAYRADDGLSSLGFESEQAAPLSDSRTAGGVEWRINTYEGDWHAPADRYRDWMERNYRLPEKRAARPEWVKNITLAVSWASSNPQLLDSLAKIHPPDQTLIHLDQWRTSRYDVKYPEYIATEQAVAFIAKANKTGFKVMPHFNYFACCKTHPLYQKIENWHVRDLVKNEPQGWFFPIKGTNDHYQMAYIHAGLAQWRRELIDNVSVACDNTAAPAAFLDQTYHAWNSNPGIVENMTMLEGSWLLQEELACIRPELVLAGENLTEISFQREAFAQAHPVGWGNMQPQHVQAAHPICAYLWKGHSRLIGYIELEPWNERIDVSVDIHRKMGVLPTFVARERSAADPDLLDPVKNHAIKRILEWVEQDTKAWK
ncbi:MAG TPA: DUF6259 domain-containing protein [Planctomycetota bacterium]|nr:DUF6259 domain-containing protein [Planctomycetota bacterium]